MKGDVSTMEELGGGALGGGGALLPHALLLTPSTSDKQRAREHMLLSSWLVNRAGEEKPLQDRDGPLGSCPTIVAKSPNSGNGADVSPSQSGGQCHAAGVGGGSEKTRNGVNEAMLHITGRAAEQRRFSRLMRMAVGAKTVAIVGGGPSGLVAARSMLDHGLRPTIFDRATAVGGMWGPAAQPPPCWGSLRTNLSRYTCCFSDFPWSANSDVFPCRRDVGSYLTAYAESVLTDPRAASRLGCEVVGVTRDDASGRWVVRWTAAGAVKAAGSPPQRQSGDCGSDGDDLQTESTEKRVGGQLEAVFDHVVVASGFFSRPRVPEIPGLGAFPGTALHSAEYRAPEAFAGQHVVVVGGSFSAAEVAAEVALHAARVTNVSPRPFWVLPRHVPLDPSCPTTPFLPLDLAFYRRSTRKSPDETVLRSGEENAKVNAWFRAMLGDQPGIGVPEPTSPPFSAVSDSYTGLVGSGRIDFRLGRLAAVRGASGVLQDGTQLPGVDVILLCTGYRTCLSFLSSRDLEALCFEPDDVFAPLLLHRGVWHPELPGLAFVGMYRGPYFAVMELQARWAAAIFSGALPLPSAPVQRAGIEQERRVRDQSPRPQFPHGDYVGLADSLAAELNQLSSHVAGSEEVAGDVVLPGSFRGGAAAAAAAAEVERACANYERGAMVAATAFRSLQGDWQLRRQVDSRRAGEPSGVVVGCASFTPPPPAAAAAADEYFYSERGDFLISGTGQSIRVRREYVYAYEGGSVDVMQVYFANSKDPGGGRGGPFLRLLFLPPDEARERLGAQEASAGWIAVAEHLCGEDTYQAVYRFAFSGVHVSEMVIKFVVTGPRKDYVTTTTYTRQLPDS